MEQLSIIQGWLEPVFEKHNVQLYSLQFLKDMGMNILQVAITNESESIDLDICADVSEDISTILDTHEDAIDGEYYLEVCSAGAERELTNDQQIEASIEKYVYVSFKKNIGDMEDVTGYLKEATAESVTVEYMNKTVRKRLSVAKDNIKKIRLAVKI